MQTQTQTQTKASAVKSGMVKIVALIMLMIGINAQAFDKNNPSYKTLQSIMDNKSMFFVPISIVGTNSIVAALSIDYSKSDKYTPPTIRLSVPISEKLDNSVDFQSFSVTMENVNDMAKMLGVRLDYCASAHFEFNGSETEKMVADGNRALCMLRDVIDLEFVLNRVDLKIVSR